MSRTAGWTCVVLGAAAIVSVLKLSGCGPSMGSYRARAGQDARSQSRLYVSRVNAAVAARHGPPGSLPALDEEVWVIVKAEQTAGPAEADDVPGTGAMMGLPPGDEAGTEIPLPLEHTDVGASISAYIASVTVTQRFHNPYDGKIEAVYVFPLPGNAAVNGFVMTIGERRIRGIIREREEAERIYTEAKHQGYVAALLTQERANVFTQHVANIEPGKAIDVEITYFHTLAYDDGWYEYVFPMVVGPRFNPPGFTGGIGAVGRGRRGASGQTTEVQYLRPHERSGHDISLAVELEAGVRVEEVRSPSHRIDVSHEGSERLRVALSPDDAIPNKDFVLRYRVAGDQVKTSLLTYRDDRGGWFTLMLYPPQDLDRLQRRPMEMMITGIALEYGLMSAYTSFVAVDSKTRTAGAQGTTVHVPVPVPEGVRYETTVQD